MPYKGDVVGCAECAWPKIAGKEDGKFDSRWDNGVWPGQIQSSNEQIIATPRGIDRVRATRPCPKIDRRNMGEVQQIVGEPWKTKAVP